MQSLFAVNMNEQLCRLIVLVFCLSGVLADSKLHHFPLMKRSAHKSPEELFSYKRASIFDTYMYGSINTTFEYYTAVQLGTDGQVVTVQVDTGSTLMAVPAASCKEYDQTGKPTGNPCAKSDAFYDSSLSKEGAAIKCTDDCYCGGEHCVFQLQYGDGSFLAGTMMEDKFTIAGISTKVSFGQIEKESAGFERPNVDGIMGLAYKSLDPKEGPSVFESLVDAGQTENSFSMCLGYSGGMLVLGGMDPQFSAGPAQYTPIISETYYVVNMTDFKIDTTSIGVPMHVYNDQYSIVDSGTTLLLLPPDAYNAMVSLFRNNFCPKLGSLLKSVCFDNSNGQSIFSMGTVWMLTRAEILQFPTLNIVLDGINPLPLGPESYFLEVDNGYSFGITSQDGIGTILGDVFMQAYNIEFDRANKRVGFAPVGNCTGSPAIVVLESGDGQVGTLGWYLSDPLAVKATYENGLPAAGLKISFSVTSGGAKLDSFGVTVTDELGVARIKAKLTHTGTTVVTATAIGSSVDFTLTGSVKNIIIIVVSVVVVVIVASLAVLGLVWFIRRRKGRMSMYETEVTQGLLDEE